jgi:hypothetical protein
MMMWRERRGLTRWTTPRLAPAKARCGRDYQPPIPLREGKTLRLTGQSTGARNVAGFTGVGRHFRAVLVRKRSNVGGRTSATGHLLLQNHTCLRTSIIVGTNRRAGRWDAIFGVGKFRILDLGRMATSGRARRHGAKDCSVTEHHIFNVES